MFFILFSLNLAAQDGFPRKEDIRNSEGYSYSEDDLRENLKMPINPEYFLNRKNKYSSDSRSIIHTFQTTTDLLDSVVYVDDEVEYKEYFTYDSSNKRLTWIKKRKTVFDTNWVNDKSYTDTYDDDGNLLTHLYQKWNDNIGSLINYRLSTYTRDDAGNILTSLYQKWDSSEGIWENSSNRTHTYDDNGNKLTSLNEQWDSDAGAWTNYWSVTYTYDGNGNMLTSSDKDWNSNDGSWINHWRRTFTYDNAGSLLTLLAETWENIAGIWEIKSLTTNTYNESGNLLTDLIERWDSDAETWENSDRETYTYDNNENILTNLSENWDVDSSKWVNDERHTYTYDSSGNMLTDFFEDWRDNTYWKNGYLINNTYDETGNLLASIWNYWNSNDQIWWESMHSFFTYNNNGNLIYTKSESWSGSGWEARGSVVIINNLDYKYQFVCEELNAFYGSVTSLDNSEANEINSFSLSQNYPNPFNPSTKIKYTIAKSPLLGGDERGGLVTLKVYDILGREVAELVNEQQKPGYYEVQFNASGLTSGIYFYTLHAGTLVQTKKMLLLR